MPSEIENSSQWVNAAAELVIAGKKLKVEMPVPAGPVRLGDMLSFFRYLTDSFVALAEDNARADGTVVSCKKGCGACCRQLVPVAEVEARHLEELIERLPEARRSEIRNRFERARERLQAAGLLDVLLEPGQIGEEAIVPLGLAYFGLGIACPFLEDESCSIHAERPLACREYLVVSPAEHCASPSAESIKPVKLVVHTAKALRAMNAAWSSHGVRWLPLILSVKRAEAHADTTPLRPGVEWVREAFARVTGRPV
ncbi:MAG: YkgJ family cysteine cluster protein [Candidatus Competibacteraceae bacterium]|nr:YkgJ family cysteine cluster protein [Candidatus Competibacteraceae bacterium]MBK7982691.1 YkgJ family cysteine cluster protein [Candidatus Competibacteraceae bacterium]MBK8898763.1 YkgJ family cysteine cluster protein [Candidatus Competibacteraceae bacterium]MBK8962560.1 YkgJ family cysteine cluster protein [Candidatus Competibacteraceae bacterium]MBK9951778.1 YkgJ family cysteine cluster protein [Candidatus Competibacteraceae bacterium]